MIKAWGGEEWQEHIHLLLKRHYGPGQYQEVPDKHKGDFGLEGFSRDGCAYQCYAAEEPVSTDELYGKQRDKITKDIQKFINNKDDLQKLFGVTKISRWILMVPRHESALLIQHAEKKAKEVRDVNLPYVVDEFCIHVETEDAFAVELALLTKTELNKLDLDPIILPEAELENWVKSKENSTLIDNLNNKLKKLPNLNFEDKHMALQFEMIKHYISGQNYLASLLENYPDIYESILRCKKNRENFLVTECLLNTGIANQLLSQYILQYKEELSKQVTGIKGQIDIFVYEAVSDWLMRCPLDFPGGTVNG